MATMNIYLPDELRDRMRSHDLNWSKVSAEAIESAINLEELKGENPMEAQLERLRQSKESNTERQHAEGVAAGKRWALEDAEYDELERVAALADSAGVLDHQDHRGAVGQVADAIYGGDESAYDIDYVRDDVLGSSNANFIRGFVEGAAEVFDQV